jgi:hypothetical protein
MPLDAYTLHKVRDRQNHAAAALDRQQGIAATHGEMREMADLKRQHDQLFRDLEMSGAPEPRDDEFPSQYRRRLVERLREFSPKFRDVRLDRLSPDSAVFGEIVADAAALAADRTVGSFKSPGELRRIVRTDSSGREVISYHGNPKSGWMWQHMSPVESFVVAFTDGHKLLPDPY